MDEDLRVHCLHNLLANEIVNAAADITVSHISYT